MANYDLTYEGSRVQNILDTGDELRDAGYIFRGEATPSTVPGTPTERVAYIGGPGTYTNFGSSITVGAGCICVFKYTGSAWSNQVINTGLSDAISSEATTRSEADTALQNAINAINNNIGNGYVYAGVATPSTSPVTGKVFYLAVTAGTYTNFGNAVVTAGLNLLKKNGSAWSVDQVIAIDAEPTQGSDHLVKSGGVLKSIIQNGPAFDLSAYNAQGGVLATYADLSAALTALNALPADFKKGGMSVKYVQTYDNNYKQYRCITDSFSANPNDWVTDGIVRYIQNPQFLGVILDKKGRILIAIENDANVFYGAGVPRQIVAYVEKKIAEVNGDIDAIKAFLVELGNTTLKDYLETTYGRYIECPEYIGVLLDKKNRVLLAIKNDSDIFFGFGCPSQIKKFVEDYINMSGNSIRNYLDKTFGKYIEDPEGRMDITTDKKKKVVSFRDGDGRVHEMVGIDTNSLRLTKAGMAEFQQAMKDAGFQPGGGGDWSERENIELPEPKNYSLLNIVVSSLPINDGDVSEGYIEYYDGLGNYFKMSCSLEAQGQSSRVFARTGGKGNYTLDLPKDIKFGSWVPQDSFHLKGAAKDVVRGILPTSYKWAWKFMEYLNAKPNRVLMDESAITATHATGERITDWPTDARCLPDGFPVEIYINGGYWGLYSWQLKKHRKNYSMDKKDYTSFFIDPDRIMTNDFQNGIWNDGPDALIPNTESTWWTGFDIKGPKDLYCMDGSKFDGDNPKELIDSTSPYYDSSNKAHKGSQTTKNLIKSFQTKYLEVKTLIDNDSIEDAKVAFNANFDYNTCMLVYIFNCLNNNIDSLAKNTLWGIYKSGKIFADLWDLDAMYGEDWVGNIAGSPSAGMWNGSYAIAEWPLKLLWALYENEIKETYANLRNAAVISLKTWHDIVFNQWVSRIGEEAYNRDIEKWSETPSYRENYTNTEYWVEIGKVSNVNPATLWNENGQYAINDIVALRLYPNASNAMRYKAVQASDSQNPQCPVTQFYEGFPQVGGFFDSPKRWEKWMKEQILLCDAKMEYFNDIAADFTAYRSTEPDYTIQCLNMNLGTNLSSYIYIEGRITRHETESEGQTVSVYTITAGNVTTEDTSKTYTTVRSAVEAASQQEADIPSENVFYIQARAKNIVYKWK